MLLVMRAQGVNDHLVIHMKYLEKNYMGATITNMTMLDKLFTPAVRDQRRWPRVLRDTMLVNELTIDDATGKPETPRLPRWGTVVRIYYAWAGVAILFLILWALLGVWIMFSSR
jgi:hypothetical protein